MIDFVYTDDCRFSYILKYFGEDTSNHKCGKCDNCLKQNSNIGDSLIYVREKIIELLNEEHNKLTEKQISDILLGRDKLTEQKNKRFFGCLINYRKEDIGQALRNLTRENKIQHNLEGRKKLYFIFQEESTQILQTENQDKSTKNFEKNIELYHALRELRETASKKFLQSANIICSDAILAQISRERPKTKSDLLSIPGFNERMFNKVGNDFLEIINSYEDGNPSLSKTAATRIPQNIIETYNLLQKRYSLKEIAKLRKLNEAVISMQIETILNYLPETDISSIISEDKLDLIKQNYVKGTTGLKELKEALPKDFSYPEIRIALAKISHQHS
jgi:ATP-dependent DNA helicase RecQ